MTEGRAAAFDVGGRGPRRSQESAASSRDALVTRWLSPEQLRPTLARLGGRSRARPFFLLDLFTLDDGLGGHDGFGGVRAPTLVYVLLRPEPFALVRLKVRAEGEAPASAADVFANANELERALHQREGLVFSRKEGEDTAGFAPNGKRKRSAAPSDGPLDAGLDAGVDAGVDAALDAGEPRPSGADLDVELALARTLALEGLLDVRPPPRANAIRVLRCELLRIANHLSWYAAFVEAVGASAPAFYAGEDARRAVEMAYALGASDAGSIVIGGVRDDLPAGWRVLLEGFLEELTPRVRALQELSASSPRFLDASKGVAPLDARALLSWAVTGPALRAAGLALDVRRARPYCGYARYGFQVPAGVHGDVYDRARVRLEEVGQSLRLLAQCAATLPDGAVRADLPRALPPGEALALVEGSEGVHACSAASDGGALFVRERAASRVCREALLSLPRGVDARELDGDERPSAVAALRP